MALRGSLLIAVVASLTMGSHCAAPPEPTPDPSLDALLARARAGEAVEGLRTVKDPRVDAFFREAVRPGGPLAGKANWAWGLEVAAARLGPQVAGDLLAQLVAAPAAWVENEHGFRWVESPAQAVVPALALAAGRAQVPALVELALGRDTARAMLVLDVLGEMSPKAAEAGLLRVIEQGDEPPVRRAAVEALRRKGSTDVTPVLLSVWPDADAALRAAILDTLASAWFNPFGDQLDPLPSQADAATRAAWERQTGDLVTGVLREADVAVAAGDDPPAYWGQALSVAQALKTPQVVPWLRTTFARRGTLDPMYAELLGLVGTPEAEALVLEASRAADPRQRAATADGLILLDTPAARKRLVELLADTTPVPPEMDLIEILGPDPFGEEGEAVEGETEAAPKGDPVCAHVVRALEGFYERGPAVQHRAFLDSVIAPEVPEVVDWAKRREQWKAYLQNPTKPAPDAWGAF